MAHQHTPNPREGARPAKQPTSDRPTLAPGGVARPATPFEARTASAETEALRRRVAELEAELESAAAYDSKIAGAFRARIAELETLLDQATTPDLGDAPEREHASHGEPPARPIDDVQHG